VTANQRLVCCLLIAHMTAVFVTAVPGLNDFGEPLSRAASEPVTPLTSRLDAAADRLIWLHRAAYAITVPLRPLTVPYIRVTGLFQRWDMFSNPSRLQLYSRVGYRMRMPDGTVTTEYEQVLPTGPTGVVKIFSAYFDSFMDKAMNVAGETYRKRERQALADGESIPTDAMVQGLMPYTRYFGHRRERAGLPADTQLIAIEFWSGTAPLPTPGSSGPQSGTDPVTWRLWAVDEWR